jgi:hypothetical protein
MLSNEKSFYKIIDDRNFEEIQIVGSKKYYFKFHATQYPEMLKIQDMLAKIDGNYIEIEEKIWIKIAN